MKIGKVYAVYFSATGTTRRVATHIAATLAESLGATLATRDFTLPAGRAEPLMFVQGELIVFGTPVYAGRVPNVLLKYLDTMRGDGALAVPVVLFGNRAYDDALIEQRDLLDRKGFGVVGAAAFVGEHSFSTILGAGRPDSSDLALAGRFALELAEKVRILPENAAPSPLAIKGNPYPHKGYYRPRDGLGEAIDLLKVKPRVNDSCTNCGLCVGLCPMGSISGSNVREYTGICIKCGACTKGCPAGARYYDDPGYLYHQQDLEQEFTRSAAPEIIF